ncbi:hypothetical protein CSOJ01_05101 [Colletotrichum sojae]|uniref:Inheritance of peroxisomes protein 1 n=1 Tax=Colletotrichum sojae TaxID=2175907 RepID=A0A8H6MXF1_9PEZI|nr:hypothetical protein CSOJ01_05101 [Colletotrichum sojae]
MESLRPNYPAPRRVATAPITTPAPRSTSAGGLVETLYNHPNVKIVAFTAASRGRARSPGRGPPDEPGTLSAHSQLERTIAIGPFRIYRTGSVAFLNCGSALQPMLPKSQCWALEEDSSKFVLQIRRPSYWRIEIPVTNPTEQELAAALRGILDQILQFEKTECPFKRSFTIVIPEKPKTPAKKRPWTPPVNRVLPVLSTPAHEVESPTPRSLTPNTSRRPSTSSSFRGRSEQRRFSVIGTEFQASPALRGVSVETTRSYEPPRDQGSAIDASAILEEQTEMEQSPAQAVPTIEMVPEPFAEHNGMKDAASVQASTSHQGQAESNLIAEKLTASESKETLLPDRKETRFSKCSSAVGMQNGSEAGKSVNAHVDSKDSKPSAEATPSNEEDRPATAVQVAALPGSPVERTCSTQLANGVRIKSPPVRGEQLMSADKKAVDIRPSKSSVPARLRTLTNPSAQPQIKEQLITVEVAPLTPSSIEAGTPTPTNIYDVIRNYEQKLAAAAPSAATAAEKTSVVPEEPRADSGSVNDNGSSQESHSGTDGEESCEILEGSGVAGGKRKKLRGFRRGRTLVPPQLTLVTSPPSKSTKRQTPILEETDETKGATSPTGSHDSFHSVESWHSPVTPVPRSPASDVSPTTFPYPHDNILIPKRSLHYRDISDLTVTPETRRTWDATSSLTDDSSQESAATAPDITSEAIGQPDKTALSEDEAASSAVARRPYIRHRATTSISMGRRTLSPLPPPANLFAPTTTATRRQPFLRSQLDIVRRLPMAIVSKTCEVLLGPPSHLIALMLQVAAKIAAGQWRGMMFGYGEGGETIPVQWDYSDDEYSSWGEDDDYYLSQVESSGANSVFGGGESDNEAAAEDTLEGNGRGWEVD